MQVRGDAHDALPAQTFDRLRHRSVLQLSHLTQQRLRLLHRA